MKYTIACKNGSTATTIEITADSEITISAKNSAKVITRGVTRTVDDEFVVSQLVAISHSLAQHKVVEHLESIHNDIKDLHSDLESLGGEIKEVGKEIRMNTDTIHEVLNDIEQDLATELPKIKESIDKNTAATGSSNKKFINIKPDKNITTDRYVPVDSIDSVHIFSADAAITVGDSVFVTAHKDDIKKTLNELTINE